VIPQGLRASKLLLYRRTVVTMAMEKMQTNSSGGRCPHCDKPLEQPGLVFTLDQNQQSSASWSKPQCPDRCQDD